MTTLTFDSLNPATGTVVGSHPKQGQEAVHAAVGRAEEAAAWWAGLVQAWPRLREWVADNRDGLPVQRRLAEAA
ncbi:hypothetical protein AB0K48_17200, partial [Nonomuraea sp. NPDC055795]